MAIHFSLKKEIGRFPPNSANKSEQNQSRLVKLVLDFKVLAIIRSHSGICVNKELIVYFRSKLLL